MHDPRPVTITMLGLLLVAAAAPGSAREPIRETGGAAHAKPSEAAEMLWCILGGTRMGPGEGWFHPGQCRFDWAWLAGHCDADKNGSVSRQEFPGATAYFERLDRSRDGVITAEDLNNASPPMPPRPPARTAGAQPKQAGGPSRYLLLRGLLEGEIGSFHEGPRLGDAAPEFTLQTQDQVSTISLHHFRGKKPVVLVFGSFT